MTAQEETQSKRYEQNQNGCSHFEVAYQRCFDAWLKDEILKGQMTDRCRKELVEYRACLEDHYAKQGDHAIVALIERFGRS